MSRSSKKLPKKSGSSEKPDFKTYKSRKRRQTSEQQKPAKRYKLATKKRINKTVCEHKPINRFKLIKRCELKKPPKTPKFKAERRSAKPLKIVKTHKFKAKTPARRRRQMANKPSCPLRMKTEIPKMVRRPKMDVKNEPQECSSSENSSLNFSEPVPVPRKPSVKRPLGFKALLCRLFGLNPKRRPKPQPFQF